MLNINENTFLKVKVLLVLLLSIFVILYSINTYKEGKLIGSNASNVITVSGSGDVDVKPDLANITLTVREQGKDAKSSEKIVSDKTSTLLKSLNDVVEDKDIKTENYNSNPRYSYPMNAAPKIEGYETVQNISIKVRNVEDVPKVLSLITAANINEVSGPNYTVDNDDVYKDQARSKAIADAKKKAEVLANQLGVKLVRIVSFQENSDYNPYPIMYKASMAMDAVAAPESLPSVPAGENNIKSSVSITYEIK